MQLAVAQVHDGNADERSFPGSRPAFVIMQCSSTRPVRRRRSSSTHFDETKPSPGDTRRGSPDRSRRVRGATSRNENERSRSCQLRSVGEAADGFEAVDACARARPDVVLMDVRMPRMDGLDATRRVIALARPPRVLVLTTYDLDAHVYAALRAGASGFLLKDTPGEQLIDAVRLIAGGNALLAPSVTRRLIEDFVAGPDPDSDAARVLGDLSERETEVLLRLARGPSNPEIAADLVVSETTVRTHVSHILAKLGLRDRVQAVVFAYESGLVRAGEAG